MFSKVGSKLEFGTINEMTSHHITSHVANNHINSPQITSETTTLLRQTNTLFESSEQRFNQSKSSEPFYRHMFCWFIYTLPFWNFRHRLVRYYWYIYIYKWKGSYTVVVYNMTYKSQYLTSFGHCWETSELALQNRDTSSEVSDTIVDLAGSCKTPIAPIEKPILHWTVNVFLARNIFIDNDRYWSICYCV